jgi:hypothetical protein
MMEAVRTSETSVDNHFTRQYIPEDSSEHHTERLSTRSPPEVSIPSGKKTKQFSISWPRKQFCDQTDSQYVQLLAGNGCDNGMNTAWRTAGHRQTQNC